jgi:hypothetical protein
MTPTETAAILRQFNEWRRGDEDIPQPDPREISEAIDAAVEMIDRIEAAEKERDWHAERCEDAMNECAALRVKIEAMERQEPVVSVWRCDNGHIHGSCDKTLPMGAKLYALPGAKGEIK